MGLLYVDEAGNSGLTDTSQPNFLYGGVYLNNEQWKNVNRDLSLHLNNTKASISAQIQGQPVSFSDGRIEDIQKKLDFFQNFHFHAKEIIRGSSLWLKLDNQERFLVLEKIIDICINYEVQMYVGFLHKPTILEHLSASTCREKLQDYKMLIPYFLNELEKTLVNEYVLVRAKGDIHETELISKALLSTNKFFPDEFIFESKKSVMLQAADTILWVLQAYYKIDLRKPTFTAKEQGIIRLFNKLDTSGLLNVYNYNPIYL